MQLFILGMVLHARLSVKSFACYWRRMLLSLT